MAGARRGRRWWTTMERGPGGGLGEFKAFLKEMLSTFL